jgi:hypothetical protein
MSTATAPPKVKDLLLPGEEPPPAVAHAVGEAAERDGVGGALTRLTPVGLDILGARIGRLVGELLNIDLGSVIGSALTKNRAVFDALRSTAEKPGAEAVVPLADHTLTSAYSPAVDIVVDAATVTSIPFRVVLATTIEGGLLVIRGGRMVAVRAGRVRLSASLACEGVRIAEHEAELDLPAVMGLPSADARPGAVVTAPAGARAPEPWATEPAVQERGARGPDVQEQAVKPSAPPVGLIENGWRFTPGGTWEPAGHPRPGDIVNGHRLNTAGTVWEPLPPG